MLAAMKITILSRQAWALTSSAMISPEAAQEDARTAESGWHELFVPVPGRQKSRRPYIVAWPEAMSRLKALHIMASPSPARQAPNRPGSYRAGR